MSLWHGSCFVWRRMSKRFGSLAFVLLLGMACGGTTDIGDEGEDGGTSPGGSGGAGNAGKSNGGSSTSGTAGKATGGSVSMGGRDAGGAAGVLGFGGTIIVVGGAGGAGGAGVVDPRCPEHQPTGACSDDVTLACQYDQTGCLCYSQPPNVYTFCTKVDPLCTYVPPTAPPPEADADGSGGFSAKVALPPRLTCRCSAGTWACNYGF